MKQAQTQRGFSLVEVLVSFAILSLSLIVLFRAISDSAGNITFAEAKVEALAIAHAKIATVGHEIPLKSGVISGTVSSGFRWSLNISPYQPANSEEGKLAAYWIAVHVTSTKERGRKAEVKLKTIKIGATDE